MNEAIKPLLGDVKCAVASIEKLDVEALPRLVAARLLLAIEKTRADLMKAKDAATAAATDLKANGTLFQKK